MSNRMLGNQSLVGAAKTFLAVVPAKVFLDRPYLKRLLLMFDQLAIDLAPGVGTREERAALQTGMTEIKRLMQFEMVTVLSGLLASGAYVPGSGDLERSRQLLLTGHVAMER